jgi:glycosyltransferase 2 family protein
MKRTLRRLIYALLLAVLVYGAFVVVSGYDSIAGEMQRFAWWTFAAALGLASLNYGLRFLKWQYYLARLNVSGVGTFDSFLVFLSGFVLTVTPGKVGEVFKSAVLQETHGVALERTAPIVVAERLTDVIGVVILILLGSSSFDGGLVWAALGFACVALGLVAILWRAPGVWLLAQLRQRGWLARFVPKLETAFQQLRMLSSPRVLLLPTALSIVAWALEGAALYLLLRGFAQTVALAPACFFYATATLAGALTPVPGGLGVTEALLQQQMVRVAAVDYGAATASMLLIRLATLWWAVLVGFVALAVLKLRFKGLLAERE